MKKYLPFFLLFVPFFLIAQTTFNKDNISKKTIKIAKTLAKVNELMSQSVGYEGIKPKQYENFEALQNNATVEELIELTNYSNAVVRCYAFWALTYRQESDLFPIIVKHISDNEYVSTQFGCIGWEEKVGDFFINLVTPNYIDGAAKKLSFVEFERLDSILLFTPNSLSAKSNAIQKIKPQDNIYSRIRVLALDVESPEALVTLAKYQKKEDIELILKRSEQPELKKEDIYYLYRAIYNFPHPDFFPFLEKRLIATIQEKHISSYSTLLYKAIANYQNEEAIRLLEMPFTQVKYEDIREYHINYISEALYSHKNIIYDNLLWRLWAEENKIKNDVFEYLYAKNPDRAYQVAKTNLEDTDTYYTSNLSFNNYDYINTPENLLSKMLNLALTKDKVFAFEIIRKNIKEAGVHIYPIFTSKVIDIQDTSFVTPLFERLRREDNAHIYLKIVDALISYKDDNVNQQILALLKVNPALTEDWGGKELEKKLKENKIK